MSPTVSVLVPNYNKERFIEETLDSVRAQTYQDFELIIVDDASTDHSVEVIQSWIDRHDYPCTFIQHSKNKGVSAASNTALSLAKGKYLAFLDSDDVFLPDKLKIQVAELEKLPPHVGVIYSNAYRIDEEGNYLSENWLESRKINEPPSGHFFEHLENGNFVIPAISLIRRECFDQVGRFDERLCFQDWDMFLRISEYFEFSYSPSISVKYRLVKNSISQTILQTDKYAETEIVILAKSLKSEVLDDHIKTRIFNKVYYSAIEAFKRQKNNRRLYLKKAFKARKNFKLFICLFLNFLPDCIEKRICNLYFHL